MKKIFVLGATGSIGKSTLEVVSDYPEKIKVVGISAHNNDKLLSEIGFKFKTNNLILTNKINSSYSNIKKFGYNELLKSIANSDADIVINGIAGSSGLLPSFATINSGKDLALANKETMVMAGKLITKLAKEKQVNILPVDSEHSAIFHLINGKNEDNLQEIILTASGGAFRDLKIEELKNVTLQDALKHPTWSMGQKITIDSASMANKGLEVIEAAMLFNIDIKKINVLIHPESYVHSLIRFKDSSLFAQISNPDMKLPIQSAILFPEMENVQSSYLDLAGKSLNFNKPDFKKYKMLQLAYKALERGQEFCIAYNATNEVLVEYFMNGKISFLDIPYFTEKILETEIDIKSDSLDNILEIDKSIREKTIKLVGCSIC